MSWKVGLGVWSAIRGLRYVKSTVRGMNAGAVGPIYTAVYRLWQIGYIDEGYRSGTSLALEPWWVVVMAMSFVPEPLGRYCDWRGDGVYLVWSCDSLSNHNMMSGHLSIARILREDYSAYLSYFKP